MTGLGSEYMHRCPTSNVSAAGLLVGMSEGCNRGTSAGVVHLGLAIGHEPSRLRGSNFKGSWKFVRRDECRTPREVHVRRFEGASK